MSESKVHPAAVDSEVFSCKKRQVINCSAAPADTEAKCCSGSDVNDGEDKRISGKVYFTYFGLFQAGAAFIRDC